MKKINGFIMTDIDCVQYCKKISDTEYMYLECREAPKEKFVFCRCLINLNDYSLDDIWEYCEGYYDSYEEIVSTYGFRTAFQIMAECIFEQLNLFEMNEIQTFDTFEEAQLAATKYAQTH